MNNKELLRIHSDEVYRNLSENEIHLEDAFYWEKSRYQVPPVLHEQSQSYRSTFVLERKLQALVGCTS